jgi:phenylacetate-coenzyme A ligase PaaK-like adenylate-forming protein
MNLNWRKPLIRAALAFQNPHVLRELRLIRSIERATPDTVAAVQRARLTALLHFAWSETDYYRDLLDACGAVRDGRVNLDRFQDIPFLTKDLIRAHQSRMRPRSLPKGRSAHINRSGGSTGEPLQFWQDNVYWAATIATRTYHFSLTGKDIGEREMKIWGSEQDLFKGTIGARAKFENWIYNRQFEQCWHLPEERILKIIHDINTWRPKMLWCYRDGIDAVARYVNQNRISMHSPAAIVLGGATVYPFMVQAIEKAFEAPAISAYGSREIGAAACQCLKGQGHHIASHTHVIESIGSDDQPHYEREGDLAITPLLNYAMPFIRYRIGDRGVLTRDLCSCGRSFPLLSALTGRTVEVFTNSKGEQVDPIYFIQLLSVIFNQGFVRKFQVVQEQDGGITINFVLASGVDLDATGSNFDDIRSKILLVMGRNCLVRFNAVDDIPLSASGKYPYIVSRRSLKSAERAEELQPT